MGKAVADEDRVAAHLTDAEDVENSLSVLTGVVRVRLLFVCARNRLRSPTAERVFAAVPGVEAESAGVATDAENPVTPELIAWADVILVMEPAHRAKLSRLFSAALRGKRVVCLDVPDDYEYMAPELVQILRERVGRAIPTLATDGPA